MCPFLNRHQRLCAYYIPGTVQGLMGMNSTRSLGSLCRGNRQANRLPNSIVMDTMPCVPLGGALNLAYTGESMKASCRKWWELTNEEGARVLEAESLLQRPESEPKYLHLLFDIYWYSNISNFPSLIPTQTCFSWKLFVSFLGAPPQSLALNQTYGKGLTNVISFLSSLKHSHWRINTTATFFRELVGGWEQEEHKGQEVPDQGKGHHWGKSRTRKARTPGGECTPCCPKTQH